MATRNIRTRNIRTRNLAIALVALLASACVSEAELSMEYEDTMVDDLDYEDAFQAIPDEENTDEGETAGEEETTGGEFRRDVLTARELPEEDDELDIEQVPAPEGCPLPGTDEQVVEALTALDDAGDDTRVPEELSAR